MPDINGIPYVESSDLVSAYPTVSQDLAQEVSDQLASKLPYSYGTATPTTTDSGFLWYDSNTTPPVAKYWNGSAFANLVTQPGLELITAETISGVSSVSVNSCFTTGYDTYRIILWLSAVSTGQEIFLKFRASGSDLSGSSYLANSRGLTDGGTLVSRNYSGSSSGISLGFTSGAHTFGCTLDTFDPNGAQRPMVVGLTQGLQSIGGGFASWRIGGKYNAANTADGMSILTSTGTMTGTLRIYGYKD